MYGFDLIWSKTYQCPKCSFTVVGQIPHCSKCGTWFKLSGAPKRHFQLHWPILMTFGILAGLLGGLIAYLFASPWLGRVRRLEQRLIHRNFKLTHYRTVLAMDRGARVTFTFPGTALKWIGRRDAWSGIANVYIDGVLKAQVDACGCLSRSSRIGARSAPKRPCAGGLRRYFEPDLPLLSLVRTGGRSAFADAGGTAGAIRVRSEFDFSRSIASARPFFGAVVTFDCARARTRTRMLMVGSMTIVSTSPTETLAASRRSRSMMMKQRFHRYPM